MRLRFKKFREFDRTPTKATPGSTCFDVFSSREVRLRPGEMRQIPLDISYKFSNKLCCRIYPRSGLSLLSTSVGGGVVISDYRGNTEVILTNFSASDVNINLGDKIAQIMFIKPTPVFFEEVSYFSDNTVRCSGGFVSTGY